MTVDALAGRLVLRPGATPAICCERPVIGAALLGRLTTGRRAALLPDLIGTVFTLCADAQRSTARRAVKAALGRLDGGTESAREARLLRLQVARDQLQRFALDLPAALADGNGNGASSPAVAWLRDAPVLALPSAAGHTGAAAEPALHAMADALPRWLERRMFGMPAAAWLASWQTGRGAWLEQWCARSDHALAQWLASVRTDAQAAAWPCRVLDAPAALPALASELAADCGFAERPLWQGAPAETGPWTRAGRAEPVLTAWDRLGVRLAEIAQLALGVPLGCGALTVTAGEGLAWTEMSRGLLVHWVRLEPGPLDAATARAERFQVLAPTEWNFHPEGAFATLLSADTLTPRQVRLAVATLDPCVAFSVERETRNA